MELRHFRHFVAVAEELHFARAADRLGMEQSPLSHSIRNLETDVGVKLLHRTTRRTSLTRAGARFYDDAVRILEAVEEAVVNARHRVSDTSSRISLGLAEHAAGEPFTRFLVELEQRKPALTVSLREVAPWEAVHLVADRALDLAVVLHDENAPGLKRDRAWSEPLFLIAPLGHRLAESERVPIDSLTGECLISAHPNAAPGFASQLDALLERHGVRPGKRVAVKHQNTLVSSVAAGRGLALMPASIAHAQTSVAALPITEHDAAMVSWLVYREEDASDGVSFALEVAALVDRGAELPSGASDS